MKTKPSGARGKPVDPTPQVIVSERMRQEMLAIAVRNPDAFTAIKVRLTPDLMRRVSQPFAAIWRAALDYHEANGELPDRSLLSAEVSRVIEDENFTLSPSQEQLLDDLIEMIFDDTTYKAPVETSRHHAKWAVETAQKLLTQLAAEKMREELSDPATLVALPTMLQAMSEHVEAIQTMSTAGAGDLFPDGWDVAEQTPVFSTGLSLLDDFIVGMRAKEVYGFMGPYGSCKTTLAVQALVAALASCSDLWQMALASYEEKLEAWEDDGRVGEKPARPKKPVAVYASYETPIAEFRERCLAFKADVPRSHIVKMDNRGIKSLRGPTDEPLPYEKEKWADAIAKKIPILSEQQRVTDAVNKLREHIVFLDMTGKTEARAGKGKGGVPELAAELRFELQERDAKLYVLWVDHAASMCEEQMEAEEIDSKERRHTLRRIPKLLGKMIAGPMDAPVFCLQQLSGEANSRKTTALVHHTDSDECKSFAMYLDFAITTTVPNAEQVAIFRCTKHRRTPPLPHKFVRIAGDFNRVDDVTNYYTLEGAGIGIVSKKDKGMVATSEEAGEAIYESQSKKKSKKKSGQESAPVL